MDGPLNPRLDLLCSCCRARFEALAAEVSAYGLFPFEALRTAARQRALYNRGFSRTMHSAHLTGHAVDFVPRMNGFPRWPARTAVVWGMLRKAAKRHGLRNSIAWDRPHVECDHVPDLPKAGT